MSGGAVFQQALRLLDTQRLPEEATRDLLAALEAARKVGAIGTLLYEAGAEAGLARETLLGRTAGLYIFFAAGNLCDDLIDGDVTYLEPAIRLAPSAQLILQSLGVAALLEHGIPPPVMADAMREFVQAASWSHIEVRTTHWTAERYRALAESTGGRQWTAYMRLLWHGTPLAPKADAFGRHGAIAGYVGEDLRVGDRRFTSLSEDERRAILDWTRAHLTALSALQLRCGRFIEDGVGQLLAAAEASS